MLRKLSFAILILLATVAPAQSLSKMLKDGNIGSSKDMKGLSLDGMTDTQIKMLLQNRAKSGSSKRNNLTDDELEQLRSYEMDSLQFEMNIPEEEDLNLKVFGSELFRNAKLNFEPSLNIPTPDNYILGYNDELIIDISGLYDATFNLQITPEGFARIPDVGPVKVGGLSIEDANKRIRRSLEKFYTGIKEGQTKVMISLGNIRSIRVYIIGEAMYPGSYTLPSLATAFNALFACGGPSDVGSLRNIKLIRNNKVVSTVDFYDFLVYGNTDKNIGLQDNDIIKIEPNTSKVKIDGAINRRGIYEIKGNEPISKLFNFAGGLAENANKSVVTVNRVEGGFRKVIDISNADFDNRLVMAGDSVYVAEVSERFTNKVQLEGEVVRPGDYGIDSILTIKNLIERAGGLTEQAYVDRAVIRRQPKNALQELIGFNPGKILNGSDPDIDLMNNDIVLIDTMVNFVDSQFVSIMGEVIRPGKYLMERNFRVFDLIYKAHGFKDVAAVNNLTLIRKIKNPDILSLDKEKSVSFKLKLDKNLMATDSEANMKLEEGDILIVKPIDGIENINTVDVMGEVKSPGIYHIKNKAYRISELIKEIGGFTSHAFLEGAYVIRKDENKDKDDVEYTKRRINMGNMKKLFYNQNKIEVGSSMKDNIKSISEYLKMEQINNEKEALEIEKMMISEGIIALDIDKIQKNPGGKEDIILKDGDRVFIPVKDQTVKVIGEILYPTYLMYDRGLNLQDYVKGAGGFTENALRNNIFIMLPNGKIKGSSNFLGFNFYPKIPMGSTIVVPKKEQKIVSALSIPEIISMSTSVSSSLVLVYSILRSSGTL